MTNQDNKIPRREVQCMNCSNRYSSRVANPVCSKCYSTRVYDIESIPKTFGGQEVKNLRKELNELKKDVDEYMDFIMKVFDKLKHKRLDKIEVPTNTPDYTPQIKVHVSTPKAISEDDEATIQERRIQMGLV